MATDLERVVEQIAKDKGINKDLVIDAVESAVLTAAKKKLGHRRELETQFNEELGEVEIFEFKEVVKGEPTSVMQISFDDARELDQNVEEGDSLGVKIELKGLGRIAAQAAKQVIINKMREAERAYVYEEFKDREGEVVYGGVRRYEGNDLIVDIGKTEAVLPEKYQIPKERFKPGDRVKAFIHSIPENTHGPQVILSRVDPSFLTQLFEMEVPEMADKLVEIVSAARDPGKRAKIAVKSNDSNIDPVGAFVGLRGSRVQAVVQELSGERIDIIPWSLDPTTYICNALAPARVSRVIIDEQSKAMEVIVFDDQLSLAIGKKGQNVRLAVQLTGWDLDIRSETEVSKFMEQVRKALSQIPGVGDITARIFFNEGYHSIEDIAYADEDALAELPGVGKKLAAKIKVEAMRLLEETEVDN